MNEKEITTILSFFHTRANEELNRIAESSPGRFRFMNAEWENNQGCMVCHLIDNHNDPNHNRYYQYVCNTPHARDAEEAYQIIIRNICEVRTGFRNIHCYQDEAAAGEILIRLAREVLAKRADESVILALESAAPPTPQPAEEKSPT